ncbi:MAG: hypothetical protein CML31_07810 [Rhizobiales bacterium]|nr:hypothetical protein [Hoeflea sp.]MBG19857.1 hypothetical protein [Hyphomicrobiales bacterium]|tara:strand:+ start:4433 stop:4777 length:345 start_codon:yes stop_codon:yes gene_type:complete
MKNVLVTSFLVAATLAGSVAVAAAQQAGGPPGGNGGRGGHGGGSSSTSALDARSLAAARPCSTHNCRPPRKIKTVKQGECSCTYTQYTDASGDYYKKVCIRIDGVSSRRLRCAF